MDGEYAGFAGAKTCQLQNLGFTACAEIYPVENEQQGIMLKLLN